MKKSSDEWEIPNELSKKYIKREIYFLCALLILLQIMMYCTN